MDACQGIGRLLTGVISNRCNVS